MINEFKICVWVSFWNSDRCGDRWEYKVGWWGGLDQSVPLPSSFDVRRQPIDVPQHYHANV